jgi:ABC-type phosphate transport system substrate-binding protein
MKTALRLAAIVALVLCLQTIPSHSQSDDLPYSIVVNKQMEGNAISMGTLKAIYLREAKSWGNSLGDITPVDLSTEHSFYENLFGKTYVQMQAYWLNMRIKYSVSLPITKKDPEGVKQYIAENKGAIGYLKNSDIDDRVKVIKVNK